ncbi:MAG: IPTL-CTERM sorting domain-containing protein [Thermoanaerobaculales bacterium]|jgi:hypothetical protein|nr:IPTL-CTERM sorting domain-containing protein [Thermoanaerobaculales bacterium]
MRAAGALFAIVLVLAVLPASAQVFPSPTLNADATFTEVLGGTSMTLTFDGTSYWSCSGGSAAGVRYAQYTAAGAPVATYSPGIDFRSVYTLGGTVFARGFNTMSLYQQTAPGVFGLSGVTLAGTVDPQSAVVPNGSATELIALSGGAVQRWSLAGAALGSVPLVGFGSQNSENVYPQNRGVAAVGSHWFTYSNGVLSAWDAGGNRVDQATLVGAGTTFDSHFSLSFANGRIWIIDVAAGTWRGYPVAAPQIEAIPALGNAGLAVLVLMIAAIGAAAIRRVA